MIDAFEKYSQFASAIGSHYEELMQELIARTIAAEKGRDSREAALRAKLEAVEKDADLKERIIDSLGSELNAVANERDALSAKIEAMEKQEPVEIQHRVPSVNSKGECVGYSMWKDGKGLDHWPHRSLYLAPGAQPAQKAVAYLDIGAGGYMDIGTDLNDEQLASLPKGRHMLGIVGTYGVDGYVSAQPAPIIPEGWRLVPIEPTPEMKTAGIGVEVYQDSPHSTDSLTWEEAAAIYAAMTSAAPETKP